MGESPAPRQPFKFVRGIISAIHQAIGDPTVASRYQTLQDYPEGSLGHSFFHWYRDRNWALPGEHKSTSELLVNHDCCHILGGFNTDTRGEMNVAASQAGLFTDGFGFESLLEVMLDFHLGSPSAPPTVCFHQKQGTSSPRKPWRATKKDWPAP